MNAGAFNLQVSTAKEEVAAAKRKEESLETERAAVVAEGAEYEGVLEKEWAVLKAWLPCADDTMRMLLHLSALQNLSDDWLRFLRDGKVDADLGCFMSQPFP